MSPQAMRVDTKTEKYLHALYGRHETDCAAMTGTDSNGLAVQAQYLQEKYHASVEILEFAGMDISSTQIRAMVKAGKSLQGLVPEAVAVYIWQNHLYEKDS